jgi:hypothetical protein
LVWRIWSSFGAHIRARRSVPLQQHR